jgi:hypothetical protein
VCARAAWRNCNLDLPRFKFLNCHGTSLQRTDLHTGRLDLRILEDMWYAIHCSPTVSGKAACVQVIKRYQKTVGLLIVQDGFSWCFSWCLQPLNVDSCQFYDPLFSLSLSLFLISSFSWLTLCQKCLGCRISCQHGTRNAKTTSYKKLSNGKRKAYIFRAATAFPMSDDVRTCPDCFLTGRARIWPG